MRCLSVPHLADARIQLARSQQVLVTSLLIAAYLFACKAQFYAETLLTFC